MLVGKFGNKNPFETEVEGTDITSTNDFTLPDGKVDDVVVVDGELDIGVSDLTYEEFMAKESAD
jgi:hypothetical protein